MTHSSLHNLTETVDAELAAVAREFPPADVSQVTVSPKLPRSEGVETILNRQT